MILSEEYNVLSEPAELILAAQYQFDNCEIINRLIEYCDCHYKKLGPRSKCNNKHAYLQVGKYSSRHELVSLHGIPGINRHECIQLIVDASGHYIYRFLEAYNRTIQHDWLTKNYYNVYIIPQELFEELKAVVDHDPYK